MPTFTDGNNVVAGALGASGKSLNSGLEVGSGDLFLFDDEGATITRLSSPSSGNQIITIIFASSATVKHSTQLQLPGGFDMAVGAYCACDFAYIGDDQWVCVDYSSPGGAHGSTARAGAILENSTTTSPVISGAAGNFVISGSLRGNYAVDMQSSRSAADQVASGLASTIQGGKNNTAAGDFSIVCGGLDNSASGDYSIVAGGESNTASGDYSLVSSGLDNSATAEFAAIVSGRNNLASGSYSCVVSGYNNTASGLHSMVCGGEDNDATGDYSFVIGGDTNIASGDYSIIFGGYSNSATANWTSILCGANALADRHGVFIINSSIDSTVQGQRQSELQVYSALSTDASAVVLLPAPDTSDPMGGVANPKYFLGVSGKSELLKCNLNVCAYKKSTDTIAGWNSLSFVIFSPSGGGAPTLTGGGAGISPDNDPDTSGWTLDVEVSLDTGVYYIVITGDAGEADVEWTASLFIDKVVA